MNAIRCPKCLSYNRMYQAPVGKVVRNTYATSGRVYDDCNACNGSGYLPTVVVDSIVKSFPERAEKILEELGWGGDHFYFRLGDLYVGVEAKDGYIHT